MNCETCLHRVRTEGDGVCDHPVGFTGPDGDECPLEHNICETCIQAPRGDCYGDVSDVPLITGNYNNVISCEYHMVEKTIIRQNMMNDINYRGYCGRMAKSCSMPRLNDNFICPECGWKADICPEFFKRYKKKHGLK